MAAGWPPVLGAVARVVALLLQLSGRQPCRHGFADEGLWTAARTSVHQTLQGVPLLLTSASLLSIIGDAVRNRKALIWLRRAAAVAPCLAHLLAVLVEPTSSGVPDWWRAPVASAVMIATNQDTPSSVALQTSVLFIASAAAAVAAFVSQAMHSFGAATPATAAATVLTPLLSQLLCRILLLALTHIFLVLLGTYEAWVPRHSGSGKSSDCHSDASVAVSAGRRRLPEWVRLESQRAAAAEHITAQMSHEGRVTSSGIARVGASRCDAAAALGQGLKAQDMGEELRLERGWHESFRMERWHVATVRLLDVVLLSYGLVNTSGCNFARATLAPQTQQPLQLACVSSSLPEDEAAVCMALGGCTTDPKQHDVNAPWATAGSTPDGVPVGVPALAPAALMVRMRCLVALLVTSSGATVLVLNVIWVLWPWSRRPRYANLAHSMTSMLAALTRGVLLLLLVPGSEVLAPPSLSGAGSWAAAGIGDAGGEGCSAASWHDAVAAAAMTLAHLMASNLPQRWFCVQSALACVVGACLHARLEPTVRPGVLVVSYFGIWLTAIVLHDVLTLAGERSDREALQQRREDRPATPSVASVNGDIGPIDPRVTSGEADGDDAAAVAAAAAARLATLALGEGGLQALFGPDASTSAMRRLPPLLLAQALISTNNSLEGSCPGSLSPNAAAGADKPASRTASMVASPIGGFLGPGRAGRSYPGVAGAEFLLRTLSNGDVPAASLIGPPRPSLAPESEPAGPTHPAQAPPPHLQLAVRPLPPPPPSLQPWQGPVYLHQRHSLDLPPSARPVGRSSSTAAGESAALPGVSFGTPAPKAADGGGSAISAGPGWYSDYGGAGDVGGMPGSGTGGTVAVGSRGLAMRGNVPRRLSRYGRGAMGLAGEPVSYMRRVSSERTDAAPHPQVLLSSPPPVATVAYPQPLPAQQQPAKTPVPTQRRDGAGGGAGGSVELQLAVHDTSQASARGPAAPVRVGGGGMPLAAAQPEGPGATAASGAAALREAADKRVAGHVESGRASVGDEAEARLYGTKPFGSAPPAPVGIAPRPHGLAGHMMPVEGGVARSFSEVKGAGRPTGQGLLLSTASGVISPSLVPATSGGGGGGGSTEQAVMSSIIMEADMYDRLLSSASSPFLHNPGAATVRLPSAVNTSTLPLSSSQPDEGRRILRAYVRNSSGLSEAWSTHGAAALAAAAAANASGGGGGAPGSIRVAIATAADEASPDTGSARQQVYGGVYGSGARLRFAAEEEDIEYDSSTAGGSKTGTDFSVRMMPIAPNLPDYPMEPMAAPRQVIVLADGRQVYQSEILAAAASSSQRLRPQPPAGFPPMQLSPSSTARPRRTAVTTGENWQVVGPSKATPSSATSARSGALSFASPMTQASGDRSLSTGVDGGGSISRLSSSSGQTSPQLQSAHGGTAPWVDNSYGRPATAAALRAGTPSSRSRSPRHGPSSPHGTSAPVWTAAAAAAQLGGPGGRELATGQSFVATQGTPSVRSSNTIRAGTSGLYRPGGTAPGSVAGFSTSAFTGGAGSVTSYATVDTGGSLSGGMGLTPYGATPPYGGTPTALSIIFNSSSRSGGGGGGGGMPCLRGSLDLGRHLHDTGLIRIGEEEALQGDDSCGSRDGSEPETHFCTCADEAVLEAYLATPYTVGGGSDAGQRSSSTSRASPGSNSAPPDRRRGPLTLYESEGPPPACGSSSSAAGTEATLAGSVFTGSDARLPRVCTGEPRSLRPVSSGPDGSAGTGAADVQGRHVHHAHLHVRSLAPSGSASGSSWSVVGGQAAPRSSTSVPQGSAGRLVGQDPAGCVGSDAPLMLLHMQIQTGALSSGVLPQVPLASTDGRGNTAAGTDAAGATAAASTAGNGSGAGRRLGSCGSHRSSSDPSLLSVADVTLGCLLPASAMGHPALSGGANVSGIATLSGGGVLLPRGAAGSSQGSVHGGKAGFGAASSGPDGSTRVTRDAEAGQARATGAAQGAGGSRQLVSPQTLAPMQGGGGTHNRGSQPLAMLSPAAVAASAAAAGRTGSSLFAAGSGSSGPLGRPTLPELLATTAAAAVSIGTGAHCSATGLVNTVSGSGSGVGRAAPVGTHWISQTSSAAHPYRDAPASLAPGPLLGATNAGLVFQPHKAATPGLAASVRQGSQTHQRSPLSGQWEATGSSTATGTTNVVGARLGSGMTPEISIVDAMDGSHGTLLPTHSHNLEGHRRTASSWLGHLLKRGSTIGINTGAAAAAGAAVGSGGSGASAEALGYMPEGIPVDAGTRTSAGAAAGGGATGRSSQLLPQLMDDTARLSPLRGVLRGLRRRLRSGMRTRGVGKGASSSGAVAVVEESS